MEAKQGVMLLLLTPGWSRNRQAAKLLHHTEMVKNTTGPLASSAWQQEGQ